MSPSHRRPKKQTKCALTGDALQKVCKQRFIEIDGDLRTDVTSPAGLMDVISIHKTGENFRLTCDTKGRFACYTQGGQVQLVQSEKDLCGHKRNPASCDPSLPWFHQGERHHSHRFGDRQNYWFIKCDTGILCMVTRGANLGRIGVITNRDTLVLLMWFM
ncbi:hypothetical protein mRhiFer1_014659 [Rhinolophus ferrumequinum]|uniref:Uncharacterized protein n=1 Tax=Rhinolophus ferrumequinum TaxID=59479 RepID=A0A7J7YUV6_RHIFE|nr:hypothetical protein mRhiFer1_014659 [Rhinolophus ferrumequinum]